MDTLMIVFQVLPLETLMLLVMLLALSVLWFLAISKVHAGTLPLLCAAAAIFLPLVWYLVSMQGNYERMTPDEFTRTVVKTIPEFAGTVHCTNKGMVIVGEYRLVAKVDPAPAKSFKVSLNLIVPELAHACELGYYPNSPLKWRTFVHSAALEAVNGNVLPKKYGTAKVL